MTENKKQSKKMPKSKGLRPLLSFDIILKQLKTLPEIFHKDGKEKSKKDPVWEKALGLLPGLKLQNLYMMLKQNRHNLKTDLYEHFKIDCPIPEKAKKKQVNHKFLIWDNFEYYDFLDNGNISNDFDNLMSMKYSEKYEEIILQLGVFPFNVIYCHPEQISLWNQLINIETTVSLIVLNDVVSNVNFMFHKTEKLKSKNLFLYALAVQIDGNTIILAQMISESTDSLEIQHFFHCWLQNNAKAPLELAIGYSYSLLDAASLTFNFCTFDQYNLSCFQYLIGETLDLPPTLLIVDIITLVKIADGWECFQNITQSIKDFYIHCLMYLSTIDDFIIFKEAVISILSLCQSPYQNREIELRKENLLSHLNSDDINQINQQYMSYINNENESRSFTFLNENHDQIIRNSTHEIFDYINQLKLEAFELCDFSLEVEKPLNDYHCPVILENYIQLLVEFPAWTKIIFKKNDCSTLATACAFTHLTNIQDLNKSESPPKFLKYHLEKIKSLITLGNNSLTDAKNNNQFLEKDFKNNHAHLFEALQVKELEHNTEKTQTSKEEYKMYNENFNLETFRKDVNLKMRSVFDFYDFVNMAMKTQMKSTKEIEICKILFDCSTDLKTYQRFIGEVIGKFCLSNEIFAKSFKQIFNHIYKKIELFEKNKLKNSSKLFAHLLISNSISWDVLSILKISQNLSKAKQKFIKTLLVQFLESMGVEKFLEKLNDKKHNYIMKSFFPNASEKDVLLTKDFYKSIDLQDLEKSVRRNRKKEKETEALTGYSSSSSLSSSSSNDIVIKIRSSKKRKKYSLNKKNKKICIMK